MRGFAVNLAALAQAFRDALGRVWDEWHRLPGCPERCLFWQEFQTRMIEMGKQSFLHPELVESPRIFGNRWTI
jgi:hypothetical protein